VSRKGKEGVDGSSPSEGFRLLPAQRRISLSSSAASSPISVHRASTSVHHGRVEVVEQADRVLASIAGEVAVVAVDHGQAGAHVAGEVEGGDAGTEREGGEGVSEIVDPAQRLDPGRDLRGLPLAVTKLCRSR
jgi:hypothetical protein